MFQCTTLKIRGAEKKQNGQGESILTQGEKGMDTGIKEID